MTSQRAGFFATSSNPAGNPKTINNDPFSRMRPESPSALTNVRPSYTTAGQLNTRGFTVTPRLLDNVIRNYQRTIPVETRSLNKMFAGEEGGFGLDIGMGTRSTGNRRLIGALPLPAHVTAHRGPRSSLQVRRPRLRTLFGLFAAIANAGLLRWNSSEASKVHFDRSTL